MLLLLGCIFVVICSGRTLHEVRILPFGMLCLSTWSIILVNIVLSVCISLYMVLNAMESVRVCSINCHTHILAPLSEPI